MADVTKGPIGKEDFQIQYDTETPATYERVSSVGGVGTFTKFPDIWTYKGVIRPGDIVAKGPWYDVRAYASIDAAVTAIGSTTAVLFVPNSQTLTANLTIPSTMTLAIAKGGMLVKASTYTVTINGHLDAGLYQIFSGFDAGNVTGLKEARPEWWGTDGVAIESAIKAVSSNGDVLLSQGTYIATVAIAVNKCVKIRGAGRWATFVEINSTTEHLFNVSADRVTFSDLTVRVKSTISGRANTVALIYAYSATNIQNLVIEDCFIIGTGNSTVQGSGVKIDAGVSYHIRGCAFTNNLIGIWIKNSVDADIGDGIIGPHNVFDLSAYQASTYCIYHESSGGLKVIGNKFLNHQYQYALASTAGTATSILIIVGNSFDGVQGSSIRIGGTGEYNGFVISGNHIISEGDRAIEILAAHDEGVITGNFIRGDVTKTLGIKIDDATDWVISGNNIRTCLNGIYLTNAAAVARITIGSNHFNSNSADLTDAGNKATLSLGGIVPASKQTYAASNVTTDRTYDADTVAVAELADVVGTLIADLRSLGVLL